MSDIVFACSETIHTESNVLPCVTHKDNQDQGISGWILLTPPASFE